MALGLGLGLGLSRASGAPLPKVLLVSWTGNSRSIGRDTASGDTWATNARQWTQAGALAVITDTTLDVNDSSGNTQATDLSPALSFADNVELNESGVYDLVVFVPDGQGSSGFSNGVWNADGTPNRLSGNVTRWNAAYAHLVGLGYAITPVFHFYNANPDAGAAPYFDIRNDLIAWSDYIRANATGMTTGAIVIGGGQADSEINIDPEFTNNAQFATGGLAMDFCESYEVRFDRYGTGDTFPLTNFDGVHFDRLSTITQGKLAYLAWKQAELRTDWLVDYKALSVYANIEYGTDFDVGAGRDLSGNDEDLSDLTGNDPRVRPDATLGRYLYNRPSGTVRAWQMPVGVTPPVSYTKSLLYRFTNKAAAQSFWGQTDGTGSAEHRLQFSSSSTLIQAGHGDSPTVIVSFDSDDMVVDTWYLVTLTYDDTTGDMKIYLDATEKDSASSVPSHGMANMGFLGAANSTGGNPVTGDIAFALLFDKALTGTEISELNTFAVNWVT